MAMQKSVILDIQTWIDNILTNLYGLMMLPTGQVIPNGIYSASFIRLLIFR